MTGRRPFSARTSSRRATSMNLFLSSKTRRTPHTDSSASQSPGRHSLCAVCQVSLAPFVSGAYDEKSLLAMGHGHGLRKSVAQRADPSVPHMLPNAYPAFGKSLPEFTERLHSLAKLTDRKQATRGEERRVWQRSDVSGRNGLYPVLACRSGKRRFSSM